MNNRFSLIIEKIDWMIPVNSFFYNLEKIENRNHWFSLFRSGLDGLACPMLFLVRILRPQFFRSVRFSFTKVIQIQPISVSAKLWYPYEMSVKWLTDYQTEHQLSLGVIEVTLSDNKWRKVEIKRTILFVFLYKYKL